MGTSSSATDLRQDRDDRGANDHTTRGRLQAAATLRSGPSGAILAPGLGSRRATIELTSLQEALLRCFRRPTTRDEALRTFQATCTANNEVTGEDTRTAYDQTLLELERLSALVPARGEISFGDLRRVMPICSNFGYSRGSPVDRYYLRKFAGSIVGRIVGRTLEVGGRPSHQQWFRNATAYVVMDQREMSDASVAGNVCDRKVFEEASFDSIVNFNVLEHVREPWTAVSNMHHWLKPGGTLATMVPSVQRVHLMTQDYWRILPDGLRSLHSCFEDCSAHVFGNVLASLAALVGVAAEELSVEELDAVDPDYPVACCILARKETEPSVARQLA